MESAPWRIALASATGTSHEATGAPCQDSVAYVFLDTDAGAILIAAVSDGAGSAAHSEIGSRLAVAAFIDQAERYLSEGHALAALSASIACDWVQSIVTKLGAAAEENGHESRDYSCTLLGAIVGQEQAAFVQIGDGAIVVSHGEDDGWSYVFWPQHGEYANTTNFIQSPDIAAVLAFDVAPRRIDEFAVFSDGIENLVLHKASRTVHEAFFRDMIQPVRRSESEGFDTKLSQGLQRYLESEPVCERTDDDKTLVLATRAARIERTE
jgi:hypothetical protein